MADKSPPLMHIEKGKPLEQYQKAAARLSRATLPMMGDMRRLRDAAADVYIRQAEVATLVEILCDLRINGRPALTRDKFLRHVTDNMTATAERLERTHSSIFIPGRY